MTMNRRLVLALLALLPWGLLPDLAHGATRVAKVIDGDTFITEGGEKVRVLGIDTPESAHKETPAEPLGNQARQRLDALLSGKSVTLHQDQEPTDRYGRTLAYVTLANGEDAGEILLREGLAMAYFITPNLARLQRYQALEEEARRKGLGLWSREGGRRIFHEEADQAMERVRVVWGEVREVAEPGEWIHLNFGQDYRRDFTASIQRRDWERHFPAGPSPAQRYKGKKVEVRGRIHSRNGPAIQVFHPNQIKVLP